MTDRQGIDRLRGQFNAVFDRLAVNAREGQDGAGDDNSVPGRFRNFLESGAAGRQTSKRKRGRPVQNYITRVCLLPHNIGVSLRGNVNYNIERKEIAENLTADQFKARICSDFDIADYELCRVDRQKRIQPLPAHINSPQAIKGYAVNSRSALYIKVIQQEGNLDQPAPEFNVRRQLIEEQNREYEESLRTDQELEQLEQQQVQLEQQERQLMADQERRRQELILERESRVPVEPADGILLSIRFPNGTHIRRKFNIANCIQVLFDFIGSQAGATERFTISISSMGLSFINTLLGPMETHGLKSESTVRVTWIKDDTEPQQKLTVHQTIERVTQELLTEGQPVEEMDKRVVPNLPMTSEALSIENETVQTMANQIYHEKATKSPTKTYLEELVTTLTDKLNAYKEKNDQKSQTYCKQVFEECFRDITLKGQRGRYAEKGCYKIYETDFNEAIRRYNATPNKGPCAEETLEELLKSRDAERTAILENDKAVAEKEKEIARADEQNKRSMVALQAAEERTTRMEKKLFDAEQNNVLMMQQAKDEFDKKMQEVQKQNQRTLENREREHRHLLEAGLKAQADMHKENIDMLRRNRDEMLRGHDRQMSEMNDCIRRQEAVSNQLREEQRQAKQEFDQKMDAVQKQNELNSSRQADMCLTAMQEIQEVQEQRQARSMTPCSLL